MSGRHGLSEEHRAAHADGSPAVAGTSNHFSEARSSTPTAVAAREPFEESEAFVHPTPAVAAAAGPEDKEGSEVPAHDAVAQMIIHDDRPIENLPTMTSPELKLIGRCVSLCVTKTINEVEHVFYYTGLVASVTFTAVTLMYVNRYTRADYKQYVAREKRVSRAGHPQPQSQAQQQGAAREESSEQAAAAAAPSTAGGLSAHGYTAEGEVGMGHDGGLAAMHDATALLRLDAAGSLAPAVATQTADQLEASTSLLMANASNTVSAAAAADITAEESAFSYRGQRQGDSVPAQRSSRALRYKGFRRCDGSIGPLPYVTFLRKSIHDVRFGRDPRSSFYSLFQDASLEHEDMQFLRMFVRRYLVHTSEGNNPRQVPLYAFVTVRCACPEMDREMVYRVAHEELPGLVKVDKSIAKEKKKVRRRADGHREAILGYQAPAGLFSNTGILYLTKLPQVTFLISVACLLFAVVFAVFLGVSMGTMGDKLIYTYELRLLRFFIPSVAVWMIAGVLTLLNSIYVRVPLRTSMLTMVLRSIWSIAGMGCCIMVIVVAAERLSSSTLVRYYYVAPEADICQFYTNHMCTGYSTQCPPGSPATATSRLCTPACVANVLLSSDTPCYAYLWSRVQLQLIPLLVFAAVVFCMLFYSLFMLLKLWTTASEITTRLEQ